MYLHIWGFFLKYAPYTRCKYKWYTLDGELVESLPRRTSIVIDISHVLSLNSVDVNFDFHLFWCRYVKYQVSTVVSAFDLVPALLSPKLQALYEILKSIIIIPIMFGFHWNRNSWTLESI